MDQCSGKRGPGGPTPKKTDATSQFCNRIGCTGRIKSSQNTRIGSSNKTMCSKPSLRSSNGVDTTTNTCRSNNSIMTSVNKSNLDSKRKFRSQGKFDPSESSVSSDSDVQAQSNSSISSNVRPRKIFHHKSNLHNENTPSSSRSSALGPSNRSNRSTKCNSISDVVRANRSPPESESVIKSTMRKRSLEGESSSSRTERKITYASPVDRRISRSMNVDTRTRLSNRRNERNGSSVREPAVVISEISDDELPSRLPFTSTEHEFARLMNDEGLRGYNMSGIAEMLLALERMIEQDEELTREDILALETSLFLSGLNLYDQHRDMRMDIDNMSYEELLALEERMGTVSTALPEEALSKCLWRSVYQSSPSKVQITGSGEDGYETKCSICQEEYVTGDEIGNLVECQHGYHLTCINHWLQLKNWCPICKTSAAPSQTCSSS